MNIDNPWPRSGDTLFTDGGHWFNACTGWTDDQWYGYTEGYRRAADVLVQHIADTQRDQDFLVFPIVFLYRQAIEVSLKHIIWIGNQLEGRPLEIPGHHKLVHLWQQCRPMIEDVWPDGGKEDLKAVGEIIEQFEARDPKSTAFRYPVTKEGRPSSAISGVIDIRNFADVANRVIALLDGCSTGFRERLDYMQDMEREHRDCAR